MSGLGSADQALACLIACGTSMCCGHRVVSRSIAVHLHADHIKNAVSTKSSARIAMDEATTVRVVA